MGVAAGGQIMSGLALSSRAMSICHFGGTLPRCAHLRMAQSPAPRLRAVLVMSDHVIFECDICSILDGLSQLSRAINFRNGHFVP